MSLSEYITNCDDMEEKLSANEFIKTLKKVESTDEAKKGVQSNASSPSGSSNHITSTKGEDNKKKAIEKKVSGSELLVKMRSRFQHRATEPLFHSLPNASEVRVALQASVEQRSSSGDRGSENAMTMPQIELLVHTRRTDSAPIISRSPHRKYVQD
ncbi:hypothetical protein Angca_000073, partial [Angiostrongylus cantonensis]